MTKEYCTVCKGEIQIQIYKNSGICCENHRKIRDGEVVEKPHEGEKNEVVE